MIVEYDRSARIAGVGLVPWTRLGPNYWFDNYKIASYDGWDIRDKTAPEVIALHEHKPSEHLNVLNSQALISNEAFQKIMIRELADHMLLTYKPVDLPQRLLSANISLLNGSIDLSKRIEDKALFREEFSSMGIRFPAYKIYEKHELSHRDAYSSIMNGRDAVVLQDSVLSGGKGTFSIYSKSDFITAQEHLKSLPGRIVVSDMVKDARERTVQCVVTKYGVFVGPLQKQIVANPILSNSRSNTGDKFCGAEISPSDPCMPAYDTIRQQATMIGERLYKLGYRGIYGVDCLVSESMEIYVLEVNARITGVTPLLTMLQKNNIGIPFYLLHILEHAGLPYKITNMDEVSSIEGALLILHGHNDETKKIASAPASGIYNAEGSFVKASYELEEGPHPYLVQQYCMGLNVKPGGRVLSILSSKRVLDDKDELTYKTQKNLTRFYSNIQMEQI